MTLKGRSVLTLSLFLVVVFGCEQGNSNAPAKVSGKVTYKGQPVPAGVVTFHPKTESPFAAASLNEDGSYTITEAPAGEFTVTVETESINPDHKTPTYGPPGAGAGAGAGAPAGEGAGALPPGFTDLRKTTAPRKYVKIPEKYSDPKTSSLSAKLSAGKQVKDFSLDD